MINIYSPEELLRFISSNSRYAIEKHTGIRQTTLSNYVNGSTQITKMSLENAIKITNYALKIQEENKMKKEELVAYIEAFESDDNYQNEKITGLTNREVSNLKHLLWNGDLFISTKGEYIESLEDFKSDLEDEEEIENMEDEITEVKGRNFDFVIERSGSDRPLFV